VLSLLGPLSQRQRGDFKRATDIVLIENGGVIYWPRTSEQFHIRAGSADLGGRSLLPCG
jgi:hypothetical protein